MRLPILYGVSNTNLAVGAGAMKQKQKMGKGNYALAGHNMNNGKALFSPLTNAKEGMAGYLTGFKKIYEYKIDKVFIVKPEQIDVIDDANDKILTLVTCNYDGSKRMIIQAELVDTMEYDEKEGNKIFTNEW
ncbi:class A sortase [Viridibacillus soli]|uniref:class A sortase n=1 Tax=Viridibacillus soli TaxID=2798301 RepID=UPI001F3425D7|nr:class A sortase [Viridibacillus soli]